MRSLRSLTTTDALRVGFIRTALPVEAIGYRRLFLFRRNDIFTGSGERLRVFPFRAKLSRILRINLHYIQSFPDDIDLSGAQHIRGCIKNIQLAAFTYMDHIAVGDGLDSGHVEGSSGEPNAGIVTALEDVLKIVRQPLVVPGVGPAEVVHAEAPI